MHAARFTRFCVEIFHNTSNNTFFAYMPVTRWIWSVRFRFIEDNTTKLYLVFSGKIKKRYNKATPFVSAVYYVHKIILPSDRLHYRSMLNLVDYLLSDDSGPVPERMGLWKYIFRCLLNKSSKQHEMYQSKGPLTLFFSVLDSVLSINI
jgi:hypothetical protein